MHEFCRSLNTVYNVHKISWCFNGNVTTWQFIFTFTSWLNFGWTVQTNFFVLDKYNNKPWLNCQIQISLWMRSALRQCSTVKHNILHILHIICVKYRINIKSILAVTLMAVADPGFPREGAPTSKVEAQTYYLAKFFPKLHKNEKNRSRGRGCLWRPF